MTKRRRVHLTVVDADHAQEARTSGRPLRFPHPGYSPEIRRDAGFDIEPLELAEIPLDDNRRAQWLAYRAARTLVGTAPDPIRTPKTRADCPTDRAARGCGAYSCRQHLWTAPPAGRPGLGRVARDKKGLTVSQPGDLGDGCPAQDRLELEPRWLEGGRLPSSCALDVADAARERGVWPSGEEIGALLGRTRFIAERAVVSAVAKLRDAGTTAADLFALTGGHRSKPSALAIATDEMGLKRNDSLAVPNVRRKPPANSESIPEPKAEEHVITNEATAALIEVAYCYFKSGRLIPEHVLADLRDAAWSDEIAQPLRNQARRLLRIGEGEAA